MRRLPGSNADRTALVGSYDGTGPWRVLVNRPGPCALAPCHISLLRERPEGARKGLRPPTPAAAAAAA